MAFPKRIAVTIDKNSDGPPAEKLLAWKNLEVADAGKVAIYELIDELETKEVKKKRRKGTKQWFY